MPHRTTAARHRQRLVPPGAVRSAGGDEDNLEFVCAAADHATGSAAWQARTKYPLESYESDDYGNDKALIGCPPAELRSGYPGMWNNPACPPTVMTAAVALSTTHNAYVPRRGQGRVPQPAHGRREALPAGVRPPPPLLRPNATTRTRRVAQQRSESVARHTDVAVSATADEARPLRTPPEALAAASQADPTRRSVCL